MGAWRISRATVGDAARRDLWAGMGLPMWYSGKPPLELRSAVSDWIHLLVAFGRRQGDRQGMASLSQAFIVQGVSGSLNYQSHFKF